MSESESESEILRLNLDAILGMHTTLQDTQTLVVSGSTANGHKRLLIVEAAKELGYFHVACFDQDDEIMDGTKRPISKDGLPFLASKLFPVIGVLEVMRFEMSEPLLSWNRWMHHSPDRQGDVA
jgi:hypothetical protein